MKTFNSRATRIEWLLRGSALLIVLAAIVDPVFTVRRPVRAVVALLTSDSARHADLLQRTARALSDVATVVHGPVPRAHAVVMVGSAWPHPMSAVHDSLPPHFVIASGTGSGLHLESVSVPASVMRDSRAAVRVRIARDSGWTASSEAVVQLRDNGQLHAQEAVAAASGSRQVLVLPYTPIQDGAHALEIRVIDGADTLRHTVGLTVSAAPWRVLVWDARPSWLSSFVRRALERDTRFAVASRILTARDVSLATPQSVRSLDALLTLAITDAALLPHVVVVGAPERLTARDVNALDVLVREWGRAVVLLPDHLSAGGLSALRPLLGVSEWRALPVSPGTAPRSITSTSSYPGDSISLAATEAAAPSVLPSDATVLATTPLASSALPMLWSRTVGRGLVVISTAFDAWRYRDAGRSTFEESWRGVLAAAAQDVGPALTIIPPPVGTSARLTPGGLVQALVVQQQAGTADAPSAVLVSAEQSEGAPVPVALHATTTPGTWLAQVRPPAAGLWRLVAAAGPRQADTASLTLVVPEDAHMAGTPDTPSEQLAAWAESTGGHVLSPQALDSLPRLLEARLGMPQQAAPWHPMRSPWWILPLTLALGGDWWLRRRRGAR